MLRRFLVPVDDAIAIGEEESSSSRTEVGLERDGEGKAPRRQPVIRADASARGGGPVAVPEQVLGRLTALSPTWKHVPISRATLGSPSAAIAAR